MESICTRDVKRQTAGGRIDAQARATGGDDEILLRPRPPFRLDLTVWALRRRGKNLVDRWEGTYRRALHVGDRAVTVEVEQRDDPDDPLLIVRNLTAGALTVDERQSVEAQLTRLLGLDVDLSGFYALADEDALVGPLAERMRGVKPPRFPTLFEALVNAVANQQLPLEVGIELLNRISERFGVRPDDDHGMVTFPEPAAVLGESVHDLRQLGFSMRKAEYIMDSADAVLAGAIDETLLASADRKTATGMLTGLRGIGRWSAEYALLRGLGNIDVFPADDIGARNKLQRFFTLTNPPDREQILTLMEPWAPYAGLMYFHMLLDGLAERGDLQP